MVGASFVGGLVGYNTGSISNSYNAAAVNGNGYVGGLVGVNSGSIVQSYSSGPVTGVYAVGGLVGYNSGIVDSLSFWDVTASGQAGSAGGTGLTTAQAQSASFLTGMGWTFSGPSPVWSIGTGSTYPRLTWQP